MPPTSERGHAMAIIAAVQSLGSFYLAVAFFLVGGSYERLPVFQDSLQAKAQVMPLIMHLTMLSRAIPPRPLV
jgi:hypothetical protein